MFELQHWLDQQDSHALECDGMTRVLAYLLKLAGVEHNTHVGDIVFRDGRSIWHCWISLSDSRIIDLRARMWAQYIQGDIDGVPHGLFIPRDFPTVSYNSKQETHSPADWATMHPAELETEKFIANVLTMGSQDGLCAPSPSWFKNKSQNAQSLRSPPLNDGTGSTTSEGLSPILISR